MDEAGLRLARAALLTELVQLRMLREVAIPAPGAGSEIVQVVPGGVMWEVLSLRYTLVTSAVVANRNSTLRLLDNDNVQVVRLNPAGSAAASTNNTFCWAAGLGQNSTLSVIASGLPVPPLVALPGWTISTLTANIDAADAYSAVVLMVREWSAWHVQMFSEAEAEQLGDIPVAL